MTRVMEIKVYIFKENGGLRQEERLLQAAEHYFKSESNVSCTNGAAGEMSGLQVEESMLYVAKTTLGKPYFPKLPNLHLSISHSGAFWVCALAPMEVGVDIQEHTIQRRETRPEAMVRFCKMARRFFHPVEAKYVEAESFYRFFGVWAARESYVKYTGQGIDASFSEHCVIPKEEELWPELTPGSVGSVSREKVSADVGESVSWCAQGACFEECLFETNYTLCVCAGKEYSCSIVKCF